MPIPLPHYIATTRGLAPGHWRVIDTETDDTIAVLVSAVLARQIADRCNAAPPDFWSAPLELEP